MQVSAEWVSAIIAALSLGYLVGGGVQRRRDADRNAMPIVRTNWNRGELGYTTRIEIVNRLNEDLAVTSIACRTQFSTSELKDYDPAKDKQDFTYTNHQSPMDPKWTIPANATDWKNFSVDGGDTEGWLRLTLTSSAGTLRSRRLTLREVT